MPCTNVRGPRILRSARSPTRFPRWPLVPLERILLRITKVAEFTGTVLLPTSLTRKKELAMDLLWTLAIILLILWLVGLVTSYTLGGFIHILLVLAIIVILIRVIQGRRAI